MQPLRRSVSQPSVGLLQHASNGVPSAPNGASARGGAVQTGGSNPRRASGSETMGRRVLADIEWWRVDANHGAADTADGADENLAVTQGEPLAAQVVQMQNAQAQVQPAPGFAPGGESPIISATAQFAAMSITPHTPSRRHGQESSFSSMETTPERPQRDMDVDMADATTEHEALLPLLFVLPSSSERTVHAPFISIRAQSFADVFSMHHDQAKATDDPFGDWVVSPLPEFHF
ncbi:hypothetical protein BD626DRAFT_583930 [Schizophyllum amplum]|uniref:Uncharacterized protein n=1 Tax=Schizophyllum amplum TaxID=97359 RepID=A0A550CCP9_9AGAR|nr:hypothetical protein BD626DRAFT_583930 [Auriculariopsis ampla]